MRIVVAMSGGVDSSVAAAMLADQGHEVIGVSMQLYDQREGDIRFGSCCTLDDLHDARRAAAAIGIPHYIMNFERQFHEHVVKNFVQEYVNGRTPIPCSHCNSDLKFSTLLERAGSFNAESLATGHYARVERDAGAEPDEHATANEHESGNGNGNGQSAGTPGRRRYVLKRGFDPAKDQSYFLFSLTQAQLARAAFPVGHLDKAAVRAYARDRGLLVADKPDSREICFIPDGDYAAFVERKTDGAAARDGALVNAAGEVVGHHGGVHRFTVGQRKGLGLSAPLPLYVVNINAQTNTVTVGSRQDLEQTTAIVGQVNWIDGAPPDGPQRVSAQIRYKHQAASATLTPIGADAATLRFDTAQPAITPGQAAVFYDGDAVIGGGWIDRAER
jgi:tRNA-specific 2-thiouridylase